MQHIIILILILKMEIVCRYCNNEIDTSTGYPEHELMSHYNMTLFLLFLLLFLHNMTLFLLFILLFLH